MPFDLARGPVKKKGTEGSGEGHKDLGGDKRKTFYLEVTLTGLGLIYLQLVDFIYSLKQISTYSLRRVQISEVVLRLPHLVVMLQIWEKFLL